MTEEECGQYANLRYNLQTSTRVGYESPVEAPTDSFLHLSARIPLQSPNGDSFPPGEAIGREKFAK